MKIKENELETKFHTLKCLAIKKVFRDLITSSSSFVYSCKDKETEKFHCPLIRKSYQISDYMQ